MGCFLACFGFKDNNNNNNNNKQQRRKKPCKQSPSADTNHSYVPLHSHVSIKENLTSDSSPIKEEKQPKKPQIQKLKKKVRFNLNVRAYEPIPDNDDASIYISNGEEETKSTGDLHYEEEAIASSIVSYPASHRYQNCRDSDDEDEDDDLKLDVDLDETEESDQDIDDESDEELSGEEDFGWVLDNHVPKEEKIGVESKSNARDRSRYVSSVLNPVENLSQWKAVKAKAAAPWLKLQKENSMSKENGNSLLSTMPYSESPASMKLRILNVSDRPRHAIAADASLSNWLSSFEASPVTKSSSSGQ